MFCFHFIKNVMSQWVNGLSKIKLSNCSGKLSLIVVTGKLTAKNKDEEQLKNQI